MLNKLYGWLTLSRGIVFVSAHRKFGCALRVLFSNLLKTNHFLLTYLWWEIGIYHDVSKMIFSVLVLPSKNNIWSSFLGPFSYFWIFWLNFVWLWLNELLVRSVSHEPFWTLKIKYKFMYTLGRNIVDNLILNKVNFHLHHFNFAIISFNFMLKTHN